MLFNKIIPQHKMNTQLKKLYFPIFPNFSLLLFNKRTKMYDFFEETQNWQHSSMKC